MGMGTLRFGTVGAARGHKAFGRLAVAQGGKRVALPVCVLHGARPGPHVVILANQHGTELNGMESLRRFCASADPRRLRGTVFAVLSCNPRAAAAGEPVWTEGDPDAEAAYHGPYNMNYNWPGRTGGKLVERVTHELWTRAILAPHRRADMVLDLHAHQNPTAVYAEDEDIARLGVAAGIRNIVITGRSDKVNTVNLACHRVGIPCMTVELNGQGAFFGNAVREGLTAVTNLLKALGMLAGSPDLPPESLVLDPWRDHRLPDRAFPSPSFADCTARHNGLLVPVKPVYAIVRRGEVVGRILDPFTGRIVEDCRSPLAGAIYNYRTKGAICVAGRPVFTVSVARRVRPALRAGRSLLPGL